MWEFSTPLQVKLWILYQCSCQYKLAYRDTLRIIIDGFLKIPLSVKKSISFGFHYYKSIFLRSQTDLLELS